MTPKFPDETIGGFPRPPREFEDGEQRTIEVTLAGPEDKEALCEMYLDFDPDDRAQGIPPAQESGIRTWLDNVVTDESLNVVAQHDGRIVGHAILVADGDGAYELAIFVLGEYQGADIGTELLRSLLGNAASNGIERVWLSVERWNTPAIRLYEKVGFHKTDTKSFEMEMTLRLESSD